MRNKLIDTIEQERTIDINGVQTKVNLYISVGHDPEGIDTFENPDDIKAIESGDVVLAIIQVQAFAHGIEGFDSLGACALRHDTMECDVTETVAFNGMIENAISDLTKNILDTTKTLSVYMVQS